MQPDAVDDERGANVTYRTGILKTLQALAVLTAVVLLALLAWCVLSAGGDASGAESVRGVLVVSAAAWFADLAGLVVLLALDRISRRDADT